MQADKTTTAKMKTLMLAALDRMDADDLLDFFYDKCCSQREKEDLQNKMTTLLNMEGFIILKVPNIEKQDKLKDFVCSEIFPYYNEQKDLLFPNL